jgi:exodeoxyribonuclease-3
MRIISWNVNGIRAVAKKGFLEWFAQESPDVLALQETKASPGQLPPELLEPRDKNGTPYRAYWSSAVRKGYSGTAVYSKREPVAVCNLGIEDFDSEGRSLLIDYGTFTLINCYFPNSQDGGARLPYKLAFCDAILRKCRELRDAGKHFVLCGDYNIAHTPIDLARPEANEDSPGYLPEERAWMDAFTGEGFVDTFRQFHPGEAGHYSWWSYRSGARQRNVGWRIDYHCVDPAFLPNVKAVGILSGVEGSDHCPVTIDVEA